jgi:hypothetical protein
MLPHIRRRYNNPRTVDWAYRRCGSCIVVSVFLLGKLDSKHAPTDHDDRLLSRQRGSLHAKSVASLRPPIRYIMAV